MKRYLALCIVLLSLVFLSGCSPKLSEQEMAVKNFFNALEGKDISTVRSTISTSHRLYDVYNADPDKFIQTWIKVIDERIDRIIEYDKCKPETEGLTPSEKFDVWKSDSVNCDEIEGRALLVAIKIKSKDGSVKTSLWSVRKDDDGVWRFAGNSMW